MRTRASLLVGALAGCSASPPPHMNEPAAVTVLDGGTARAEIVTENANTHTTADADAGSATPLELFRRADARVGDVRNVKEWDVGGGDRVLVAEVQWTTADQWMVHWLRPSDDGTPALHGGLLPWEFGAPPVVLDVTGDGRTELIARHHDATTSADEMYVYEFPAGAREPRALPRIAWLLKGSTDAGLRPMLTDLTRWQGPETGVPTRTMILKLEWATPAQLRALVAPSGVDLCEATRGEARRSTNRCTHYNTRQLTDAVIHAKLRPAFGHFPDNSSEAAPEGTRVLNDPECTEGPLGSVCIAAVTGNSLLEWKFSGAGPARTLRAITHYTYLDGTLVNAAQRIPE